MRWPFQHFTTSGLLRTSSSPLAFPYRTIIPVPPFIVMKKQSWLQSLCSWSSQTQKQPLGMVLVCDWISINRDKYIFLYSNRKKISTCTDKRVAYISGGPLVLVTWSIRIMQVKYVIEGTDWIWYCNPYNTFNINITSIIHCLPVVLYNYGFLLFVLSLRTQIYTKNKKPSLHNHHL